MRCGLIGIRRFPRSGPLGDETEVVGRLHRRVEMFKGGGQFAAPSIPLSTARNLNLHMLIVR